MVTTVKERITLTLVTMVRKNLIETIVIEIWQRGERKCSTLNIAKITGDFVAKERSEGVSR